MKRLTDDPDGGPQNGGAFALMIKYVEVTPSLGNDISGPDGS